MYYSIRRIPMRLNYQSVTPFSHPSGMPMLAMFVTTGPECWKVHYDHAIEERCQILDFFMEEFEVSGFSPAKSLLLANPDIMPYTQTRYSSAQQASKIPIMASCSTEPFRRHLHVTTNMHQYMFDTLPTFLQSFHSPS